MQPHSRPSRRLILLLLLIVVGAAGAWFSFSVQNETPPVLTAKVARSDLEESVLASGTLEASKLVSVGAQVSGQLKVLHVALGDKVTKDQLIAEIDSLPQQNELHNAEASLENARAKYLAEEAVLKQAEAAYARQKAMRKRDAISKESFQAAEATYESSKANLAALKATIKAAEITVDTAKVNLGYTKITAPIDGTVVAVITEEGQTVNAAQQAPTIIKLAQLDTMTIKAKISEADITRVETGQKVTFTILGEPDHRYEATLRAVEPAPDSISDDSSSTTASSSGSSAEAIYYRGLFDVPNPEGKLRISMTAEVHIILNEAADALVIPRTAVGAALSEGYYRASVMLPDGLLEDRKIRIGINDSVNVEVLEGLREGEDVVVGVSSTKDGESDLELPRRRGPPMRM